MPAWGSADVVDGVVRRIVLTVGSSLATGGAVFAAGGVPITNGKECAALACAEKRSAVATVPELVRICMSTAAVEVLARVSMHAEALGNGTPSKDIDLDGCGPLPATEMSAIGCSPPAA
jgi:hypothetical protein